MKIKLQTDHKYSIIIEGQEQDHVRTLHDLSFTFPVFLFNRISHLKFQPCKNLVKFNLVNIHTNKIEAVFNLFIEGGTGYSPFRSSFGSIEFNRQLSLENLNAFIEEINKWAIKNKLKTMVVKSYPFCYAPQNSAMLTNCFLNNGYKIISADLNQHLIISDLRFKISDLFHLSEKRRLKKCEQAGFKFHKVTFSGRADTSNTIKEMYNFIKKARDRQRHPLTMNYETLVEMFHNFPNEYHIFTVRDKEKIAALTVAIKINENILYNFYPADSHHYKNFSPTVMLVKGLYDHCVENGFKLLDLGISTENSKPNFGLINFKKNLGAESSLKLTFRKEI